MPIRSIFAVVCGLAALLSCGRRLPAEEPPAVVSAADAGKLAELQSLVAAGADLEVRDSGGSTALAKAAEHGHLDVVRWLVEQGANLEAQGRQGHTPLMQAAVGGHLAVARGICWPREARLRPAPSAVTPRSSMAAEKGAPELVERCSPPARRPTAKTPTAIRRSCGRPPRKLPGG